MANLEDLVIQLKLETGNLQRGLDSAQTKIKGFGKSAESAGGGMKKMQSGMGGLMGGLGKLAGFAAITGLLVSSSKAATQDAESFATMSNSIRNVTGASKSQIAALDKQIGGLEDMAGVADDEIRPAFAGLVRATGDTTKAMALQKMALDLAAGAHVPVATAAKALGKAVNGNTKALFMLDPKLKTSKDMLGDLQKHFKGAAKTAADVDPYKRLSVTMDKIKESIGRALMPILSAFAKILQKLAPFIEKLADMIGKVVIKLMPFINQLMAKLMPVLGKVMKLIMHIVEKIMPSLVKVISKLVMPIINALVKILDGGLIDIIMQLVDSLMPLVNTLIDMLVPIIGIVIDQFMMMWEMLKPLIDILMFVVKVVLLLIGFALKPLQAIFKVVHKVIEEKIMPIFHKLMKALKPVADFIKGVLVKAFKFLSDTLGWLWSNIIQPIIDGLMSLLGMGAETSVKVKVKKPTKAEMDKIAKDAADAAGGSMMTVGSGAGGGGAGGGAGKAKATKKEKAGHTINTTVNAKTDASAQLIASQVVNAIKFNLPVAGAMGGGSMGSQVAHP